MVYLNPGDYASYGLPDETPDSLVAAASALIDAFCRRATLGVTTYVERLRVGRRIETLRLSYGPVVAITACRVRQRHLRPWMAMTPLQQDALMFGSAGAWTNIDPTQITVAVDGEAELPFNYLGLPPDEAEITYSAGYTTVPTPVQTACAQIVRNAQSTPGMNVKRQEVDSMELEYFGDTLLDDDVRRMLQPYCAVRMG